MNGTEKNLDVLQNLEFAVVTVWRAHPRMADSTAQSAYEAARQFYRSVQRGRPPRPHGLTGLDATAFEAVQVVCERRLGRSAGPPSEPNLPVTPIPVETLVDCLQELVRSVERHTRAGGRQGYLTFIDRFLP